MSTYNRGPRTIEIRNLTKRYGALTAVNDISFTVSPGEVLGFLGPERRRQVDHDENDHRLSRRRPRAAISVSGHDVESDPLAAKACMGYLPEGAPSYGEMTVRAFLEFIANVRGLTGDRRRAIGSTT